jgi:hypothetical protein
MTPLGAARAARMLRLHGRGSGRRAVSLGHALGRCPTPGSWLIRARLRAKGPSFQRGFVKPSPRPPRFNYEIDRLLLTVLLATTAGSCGA